MLNDLTTSSPSAARRTREMIGQIEARERLEAALRPSDHSFKVVLLQAEGGMGKTRLLEEILRRYGPSPTAMAGEAPPPDAPLVARLIDVIDTRLHDRYRCVTEMRHNLKPYDHLDEVNFNEFEAADDRVQLLSASGALLDSIDRAQGKASDDFIKDLAQIAAKRRIVFLIDTVERLSYEASEKLLTEGLLEDRDLAIRTNHGLQNFIADSRLENITLVLAGRGREGKPFFDRVIDTVNKSKRDLVHIPLKRLSINETRQYLAQLAEDWQESNPSLAGHFAAAADPDHDRYKVIGLYTHGVPVRLALYAQVLAEGLTIPDALRDSFVKACAKANRRPEEIDLDAEPGPPEETTPALRQTQWQIEEEFLNLLFHDPDDRRSLVFRTLVRAPRGLTAEQLHFVLDAPEGQDPQAWQAEIRSNQGNHLEKLQGLLDLLKAIATSEYLAKARASLSELGPVLDETIPETATFRVGLQDEIYRIYAEHTGLLADPVSAETTIIRDHLAVEDRARYEQNRADEQAQRKTLYDNLDNFANYQYERCLALKRAYLLEDEMRFEAKFQLDDPNTYRFPDPPLTQIEERRLLHSALAFFEIERMIYRLLQDPEHNLNSAYITLEDDNARAARQEEDFWAQAEMWRALHDDWLMKFIDLHPSDAAKKRGETSVVVLRRFAEQENVARWIKRLVLRSSAAYVLGAENREIAFAERVEKLIHDRPRGKLDEDGLGDEAYNDWGSWNHTLARAERVIWTQVAYIRRGRDVDQATNTIEDEIGKLEKLYATNVHTKALNNEGHVENGFAAAPDAPAHPAYARLRRLLSHAYNHLGYGQRTLGRMHDAVVYYGKALEYIRPEYKEMQAHRASVLNNLARALSELGWNAIDVCLNGRELRWELAEEVPLASSYNTLALIYDDMGRYEDAPLLSAKAIAYCRRAVESRQLGLSLRQMAESLRHIAERGQGRTGQRAALAPDTYYNAAEALLREARSIFDNLNQAERSVEVYLELGSLYRDRLIDQPNSSWNALRQRAHEKSYTEALSMLKSAERMARLHHLAQHVLDVRINLARVYYYVGNNGEATRILDGLEADADYKRHIVRPGALVNDHDNELRDRNWIFRHLAIAQWIRGWMALDQFDQRVAHYREAFPKDTRQQRQERVKADPEANASLDKAARAYALGIAQAELYSPRSRSIGNMQNDLYRRLRASNRGELESFRASLEKVDAEFEHRLNSAQLLLRFMTEFFGLPEQEAKTDKPVQQIGEGDHE